MNQEEFGEWLSKERKRKQPFTNLTKFATRAEISKSQLSRFESGKFDYLTDVMILRLSKAYEIPITEIINACKDFKY